MYMNRKLTKGVGIMVILLPLIIMGCSSLPDEKDAKKDLEFKINKESNGKIELIAFEKTNGLKHVVFGQELYEIEFNATIEFKEDAYKSYNLDGVEYTNFYVSEKGKGVLANYMEKLIEKGQKVNLTGSMDYEKTEKGWRATDLMVIHEKK